jgi:hypothetical protein
MFVGHDGCTANAEHQRQQRRHIYIVYCPPHGWYARFAMLAMFGASAAEVWALLIRSDNFGGLGSATFASQALPHLLIQGFLHFTWVGTGRGHHFLTGSVCWRCQEQHPHLFTTVLLPVGSFTPPNIQYRTSIPTRQRVYLCSSHKCFLWFLRRKGYGDSGSPN